MIAADPRAVVEAYYRALDEGAYDDLEALLDPAFVQHRPDRTFEGRAAFVSFMREERPMQDTTHEVLDVVAGDDRAAVRGALLDSAGDTLFEFVDVHEFTSDRTIETLHTYTR